MVRRYNRIKVSRNALSTGRSSFAILALQPQSGPPQKMFHLACHFVVLRSCTPGPRDKHEMTVAGNATPDAPVGFSQQPARPVPHYRRAGFLASAESRPSAKTFLAPPAQGRTAPTQSISFAEHRLPLAPPVEPLCPGQALVGTRARSIRD
jgi:hypothetical protein